jgi:hypothetical protein
LEPGCAIDPCECRAHSEELQKTTATIINVTDHQKRIADLELAHDELRAALIVAAREIKGLNFGERDTQIFRMLRTKSPGLK